ncbi:MAG TPA: monovalent cation/H(+) antiporter subunit G [Myxococcota bacterium]|nr:monovalent cation/H(+) antiporter subunit G [Myxococcota bacterium]
MIVEIASWILLVSGGLFCVIGGLGLLRFPDFYTRTHAASITDTMGAGLMLAGLMLQGGLSIPTGKLACLLVFILFASPTAAHALVKAAYAHGVKWEDSDAD